MYTQFDAYAECVGEEGNWTQCNTSQLLEILHEHVFKQVEKSSSPCNLDYILLHYLHEFSRFP